MHSKRVVWCDYINASRQQHRRWSCRQRVRVERASANQVARKPTQRSRPDEHQVQCVRPARTVAWNGNTQSMHESALFVEPTKERSFACAATERLTAHTCTANPTKCDVERPARTHSDVERQFTTRDDARQADTKKRSFMPERERRVRTATTPTVVHGAAALMIECALARQRARRSTDASKHSRESRHGCRNAHTRTEQRAQQRRAAHTNNARNERSYTSQSTVY